MKTTQRGFFTEEEWEAFLKSDKQDKAFLDQVVKRWEEAAAEIERLRALANTQSEAARDQKRINIELVKKIVVVEKALEEAENYIEMLKKIISIFGNGRIPTEG